MEVFYSKAAMIFMKSILTGARRYWLGDVGGLRAASRLTITLRRMLGQDLVSEA
jgi:hypothetical protein